MAGRRATAPMVIEDGKMIKYYNSKEYTYNYNRQFKKNAKVYNLELINKKDNPDSYYLKVLAKNPAGKRRYELLKKWEEMERFTGYADCRLELIYVNLDGKP